MRTMKDQGSQWVGPACATGAVAIGLGYMAAAGAPVRMIGMNIAALLVGLAAYATVVMPRWTAGKLRPLVLPGLALLLLATALAGTPVDGAARWATFGPLTLQVSLLILPAMLVLFARGPTNAGVAGLAVAAAALAIQPDRAMAGTLAAGLAVLAARRPERPALIALLAALIGFAATLMQPDLLPAVPFVDGILYSSFELHPFAGGAVLLGAALLVVPALANADGFDARLVFGAVWLSIVVAAAIGNYPTPLVGYGGSAIVGYLLSLSVLGPAFASQRPPSAAAPSSPDHDKQSLFTRFA